MPQVGYYCPYNETVAAKITIKYDKYSTNALYSKFSLFVQYIYVEAVLHASCCLLQ